MTAYLVAIASVTLIYVLLTLGLGLQYGFTGLINFGHVGFFAIGAYASALTSLAGAPLPVSIACGVAFAGLMAVPIGFVSLRLRDDFFAIVTLGFSETVRLTLISERWLTNGVQGLPGVPPLFTGPALGLDPQVATVLTILLAVAAAVALVRRMTMGPFGRLIQAIRDDEVAVTALGKDPARFKFQVLVIGSALAGLAGAFYGHYVTYVVPDQFVPLLTFYVWMAMIIGGASSVWGAVLGTVLLMGFLEGSRFIRDFAPFVTDVQMASVRLGAVGFLLIIFIMLRPDGLLRGGKGPS